MDKLWNQKASLNFPDVVVVGTSQRERRIRITS